MNTGPLRELAQTWRREADLYRRRGQPTLADMAESYAADLGQRLTEWELESLTLAEAEAESGLSYSALQKAVARGDIPNSGEAGSPRIRRRDLPRKPGRRPPPVSDGPDLAARVLGEVST